MRRRRDVAGPGGEPEDIGAASVADADDLDRLRRRLANVIGHALRTPAATVRGQAEILSVTDDATQREEAVVALRRAARRLEEMIDEVLVVEGIDTRLPTGAPQDLELRSEVEAVAAELDVVDEVEVTGDTDAMVRCGRDAVRWLLRSVLDNAGRYGTGPVRVEIADSDTVHVQVFTPQGGVGATSDDVRLAFEPFYRGEQAVTVTATRLGLGLTTARRLADELEGRIRLEQDDERGIVTHLELPRP
jgi:two-component system, OmpR family, sensor kinase